MLNEKQLIIETIKKDGKPDRLVTQFCGTHFFPASAVSVFERGNRFKGMPPTRDVFGTLILWPEDQFAAMPHVTADDKVIRDISNWRDYCKIPDLIANCSAEDLWAPYIEAASKVDRENNFLMAFMPTGLFERLHFLMGFEDTLMNFLLEPEAMADLCAALGKYRYDYMKLIVDNLHPDMMHSHDDWGSKNSLFMSPDVWREYIKPNYVDTYNYLHDKGVVIMHHSDSFLEPIIEDMVDLHIDIWQGVLPQNDIVKIQRQLGGRMTLMGGIDAAIVDREDATEEEIRTEVRRACVTYGPGGHFIPCLTYGGPGSIFPHVNPIIEDEIARYNKETYGV